MTVVKTLYPLTSIIRPYRGLRCRPIEDEYFLNLSVDKLLVFKWSLAQVYVLKNSYVVVEICCVYVAMAPHYKRYWCKTDLGRKNSASYLKIQAGKTFFLSWLRVGHALRQIFMLLLDKIGQESSCGKFMQHLESCLLWQLKLPEFCVNLLFF